MKYLTFILLGLSLSACRLETHTYTVAASLECKMLNKEDSRIVSFTGEFASTINPDIGWTYAGGAWQVKARRWARKPYT